MSAAPEPSGTGAQGALGPYLRAVRAHRLLVVLAALVALAGAAAWLALREDTFETTAELLVNPLPQDDPFFLGLPLIRDSGDPTRTVQTAATLVDSPQAATRTAAALGRGWDRARVQRRVEVEPQGESNILAITAKADDPDLAARIANTFAESVLVTRRESLRRQVVFALRQLQDRQTAVIGSEAAADLAARINQLEGVRDGTDPTLTLSARAEAPSEAVGAPAWLVLALALIAGLTVGGAGALLAELTERRVRDEEELVSLYPLPVLARVPLLRRRARRAKQRAYMSMPPAVREAFRTVQVQLEQQPGRHRTLMVTSASSGDGKTTSAVNLAASLVGAGHQVILIDFDLRKPDVGRALGVAPERGLVSLLTSGVTLADLLVPAPDLPALQVVPAAGGGGDAVLIEALSRRLPEILAEAAEIAGYVVIDTAPLGEVSDALRIASHVDDVLVVARPGHTQRAAFASMRDLLERAEATPAGVVIVGATGHSPYYGYGMHAERPSGVRALVGR